LARKIGRDFYGAVLGLNEIPKPESLAGRGGAWFELGQIGLHLGADPDFHPATKAHPCFIVDDLDGLSRILKEAGNSITEAEPVGGKRRFFTVDPFGNRLEFIA